MTIRLKPLDDEHEHQAKNLVINAFSAGHDDGHWEWKYKRSPDSGIWTQSFVALDEDKVVAFVGFVGGQFRLPDGASVPCCSVGDLVVTPEYRERGISSQLLDYAFASIRAGESAPAVKLSWTRPQVARKTSKMSASIRARPGTIRYIKALDWDARMTELGVDHVELGDIDSGKEFSVRIEIRHGPTFLLTEGRDGMTWAHEGHSPVTVSGDHESIRLFFVVLSRRRLILHVLGRRLRLKGSPRQIVRLIGRRIEIGKVLAAMLRM